MWLDTLERCRSTYFRQKCIEKWTAAWFRNIRNGRTFNKKVSYRTKTAPQHLCHKNFCPWQGRNRPCRISPSCKIILLVSFGWPTWLDSAKPVPKILGRWAPAAGGVANSQKVACLGRSNGTDGKWTPRVPRFRVTQGHWNWRVQDKMPLDKMPPDKMLQMKIHETKCHGKNVTGQNATGQNIPDKCHHSHQHWNLFLFSSNAVSICCLTI